MVHLLFEQSGTFRYCFRQLGFEAYDYDIGNFFEQTDFQIDLFKEIDNAFFGKESIFDSFTSDDLSFAFFPCVRFETQSFLLYQCSNFSLQNYSFDKKILYDLKLHEELFDFSSHLLRLVYVFSRRNLQLIIENPYCSDHFLLKYTFLRPSWIDYDRTLRGDYYVKPTMYFFINRELHNNFVLDPLVVNEVRNVVNVHGIVRSLISKDYAMRFIKEFVL